MENSKNINQETQKLILSEMKFRRSISSLIGMHIKGVVASSIFTFYLWNDGESNPYKVRLIDRIKRLVEIIDNIQRIVVGCHITTERFFTLKDGKLFEIAPSGEKQLDENEISNLIIDLTRKEAQND